QQHQYELVGFTGDYQALAVPESSQYQCLECGQLLVSPGQLLEHQEMHLKLLAQDGAAPGAPGAAAGAPPSAKPGAGSIHYECVECKALFGSQELWLSPRQSHQRQNRGHQPHEPGAAAAPPAPPAAAGGQNQALVDLEHSYRKQDEEESAGGGGAGDAAEPGAGTVQLLLYECGECLQLFQTPKDFLEHQAAHFAAPALNGGVAEAAAVA
ncbi:ZN574 protein, partial [Todus mexicanus]|nr:ZN574 protein [Todus mexicanus]